MEMGKCKNCGKRFRLHDWQNPFERLVCFTCRVKLQTLLDYMFIPENHRDMFKYRLGFIEPNYEIHTLKETAKKFMVTRERVRQVESRIIAKLSIMGFNLWGVGEYRKFYNTTQ